MNIDPKIWGRDMWNMFYYIALSYPKNPTHNDKMKYKQFFQIAGSIVPCDKCKNNFTRHINELPIDDYLESGYDLFTWVNKMDNKVKEMTNQQQYTVEQSFQYYMSTINGGGVKETIINFSSKEKILIGLTCTIILILLLKRLKII